MSSSIDTTARSFTASDSNVTRNIEQNPRTVEGMVNKFVWNVPNLERCKRTTGVATGGIRTQDAARTE